MIRWRSLREPGPARPVQDFDHCDQPRRILHRKRHYAHVDCPAMPTTSKHDHGAAQMDGADPGGVGGGRSDAADARAHSAGPPVGVPSIVVFLTRSTWWTTPSCSDLSELEVRELLTKYQFPGDKTRDPWRCDHRRSTGRRVSLRTRRSFTVRGARHLRAAAGAPDRPAVPGCRSEDRVLDLRRGTVVTGRIERGKIKWRGSGDRGAARTPRSRW